MTLVVLYPKDTEKWKQFTTCTALRYQLPKLFCIPKILKNESNSQHAPYFFIILYSCFVSQRYWKMKAIHNFICLRKDLAMVVLYPKDTEKWKQFTTNKCAPIFLLPLFCIPKILKNESNSQRNRLVCISHFCCFVSQRYWKMKAIHNLSNALQMFWKVVLYPKDTEKWKQFTTFKRISALTKKLFCIPKILKNESNSQQQRIAITNSISCFVSQRYWKMKAIHNSTLPALYNSNVVLYPKDTEKWKQFTTYFQFAMMDKRLFCIPKILKNESNSQLREKDCPNELSCFVSQRYWKMKAIHNSHNINPHLKLVVLYPKDTEKWKQFTTIHPFYNKWNMLFCIPKILKNESNSQPWCRQTKPIWVVLYPKDTEKWKQFTTYILCTCCTLMLFCIPKILKNESNSQLRFALNILPSCCFVSQRYWKMKAIHNSQYLCFKLTKVVLYPKDTEKWKQFTTTQAVVWEFGLLFCIPKILKNESNSQLVRLTTFN